ncbi:MAG: hypothetical protein M3O50_17810 [Myxococcota bacterium]|nr:hypothetical protein [Myxococcota bacterium]
MPAIGPPTWIYDVRAEADGPPPEHLVLTIDGAFAPSESDTFSVDEESAPFVHRLEYSTPGGDLLPAAQDGSHWTVPCRVAGCRVRYRFDLSEAASALDDTTAASAGGVIVAPPSAWLLRPFSAAQGLAPPGRFRFRVRTHPGVGFASGTDHAPGGDDDEFESAVGALDGASFAAFGALHLTAFESGNSHVDVAIAQRGLPLDDADTTEWIQRAVTGIAGYYGRFPVRRTLVIVIPGVERETMGVTLGEGGPSILVRVGARLTPDRVRDDWVVTHELLHVTLPSLGRTHAWLEEGIATYVEPIIRARQGLVTPAQFWRDLVENVPKGLPQAGDEGLEKTHTWARTYWGGALFCLLADLRIRERTHDARSFDDVLRGVAATGADVETRWPIERFVETGDRATHTAVLTELYREMALAPGGVDLQALWSRLGIRLGGGAVSFDDGAPLARSRRAITAPMRDPN